MEWFPSSALETVFDLEGDRFQNLILAEEPFERERGAVASERRMRIDNSNFGTLAEQARATAFVAHPYQSSGIGWPSDIESWTVEDALDFYATYYAPNNRTVVVVGDVTPEGVFELAERYFAGVPAREPPPIVRTVEPEQRGERRVRVEASAQTPMVMVAFHSGTASDPETLHLSLLSDILTDGDSSRLHRTLVEEEGVALSVRSYVHKGFDPGLTWFLLTLPPDSDPDAAEQRLVEELQRVVDDGVTVAELDKARNKMLAWYWGELETIDGRAGLVGDYDVFHGTFEAMFEVPAALEAVTVEHLRDAATAVIHEDNMTVGVLISPDDEGE
jgi:zinc protease